MNSLLYMDQATHAFTARRSSSSLMYTALRLHIHTVGLKMNDWEFELGFEELPSDDEYLDMKAAYKAGKEYVPGTVWRMFRTQIEQDHYVNGMLYTQWLEKHDAVSVRPRD